LNALDVKRWCAEMKVSINQLSKRVSTIEENTLQIYTKLASYETLKEAAAFLELALWKAKIDEFMSTSKVNRHKKAKVDDEVNRQGFRINCGADIVLRNVFPFLEPQ